MISVKKFGLNISAVAVFVTIIAAGLLMISPQKVEAALMPQIANPSNVTAEFISSSRINITINGIVYPLTDVDPYDDTYEYTYRTNDCGGNEARIGWYDTSSNFEHYGAGLNTTNTLHYKYQGVDSNGSVVNCLDGETSVTFGDAPARHWDAYWVDENTVFVPRYPVGQCGGAGQVIDRGIKDWYWDGLYHLYPPDMVGYNANYFFRIDENGAYRPPAGDNGPPSGWNKDSEWLDSSNGTLYMKFKNECGGQADQTHTGQDYPLIAAPLGTTIPQSYRTILANTYNLTFNDDGTVTIPDPSSAPSSTTATSCESAGAIAWLLCPVILAADGALNWLDTRIQGLLAINEERYMHDGLKDAWTQIRNVAFIILVPIMLVMVAGTALGFEVFSAYTIKRALPRMVIAIIFIALSWYITTFLITFFNVIGGGILGLLTRPFEFNGQTVSTLSLADLFQYSGDGGSGGGFYQLVVAQTAITLGVLVVIFLFLAPLSLIVLTAFLVLFLRQMFIVALSLLAPLAILSWIFPGNDKLWKMWWSAFSKILMMFPLIMVIIAVGRIFAAIIAGPGDISVTDTILSPLFILAAYILPYAAIPFTFKLAGGIFANLTGMMQNGEKGIFGRMREKRGEKVNRLLSQPRSKIADARYSGARGAVAWGNKGGKVRGFVGRRVANRIGGNRDWEAENSARNAEAAKKIDAEKSAGNDAQIRGATVNLKLIEELQAALKLALASEDDAKIAIAREALAEHAELDENDNIKSVKTLSGAKVSLNDAIMGHRRFNDRASQQAALTYELSKARSVEEVDRVMNGFDKLATQQWGMSQDRANEAWTGAAFGTQNQHLELKKAKFDALAKKRVVQKDEFVKELYNTKGSYPLGQMDPHTMQSLDEAWDVASGMGDTETMGQIREIVETFKIRGGVQGVSDDGTVIPSGEGSASRSSGVSSSGSAASQKILERLDRKVNPSTPTSTPKPPSSFWPPKPED